MAKHKTKTNANQQKKKNSKEKKNGKQPNKLSGKTKKAKKEKKKKERREFSDSSSSSSESESRKSSIVANTNTVAPVVLPTAKERVEIPGIIPNVKHPNGYLIKLIEDERPDLVFTQKLSVTEADCMDKHLKDHAELNVGDVFSLEDKEMFTEYEIRSKYSEGRYSALYICLRSVYKNNKVVEDKGIYMMKTLLRRSSIRCPLLIKREAKVLHDLKPGKKNKTITTTIIDTGKVCDMPYIVTTLLDRNVDRFRFENGGTVSLPTALFISMEAVSALQELHSKKYVHRDVKPSNLAFGLKADAMRVFLIDFGDTVKPGKNIKIGVPDGLTLPYWSIDCHKKTKVTYKTDLESWFYTLIDLAQQGALPWKGNASVEDVQKAKEQFWKEFAALLNEPKLVAVGEMIAAYEGTSISTHGKLHKMLNDLLQTQLNGARFVPDWAKKK